jgi:uncharacterized metal-binding protein
VNALPESNSSVVAFNYCELRCSESRVNDTGVNFNYILKIAVWGRFMKFKQLDVRRGTIIKV